MSGEFERIARLRSIYGAAHAGVSIAIGDDAAVLDDGTVLSVDAAVEDVHFRRTWLAPPWPSWSDVGARATVAALSDLAAMGASARAILSSLVLPTDVEDDTLEAIARGVAAQAEAYGAPVIGGNLSRGREISITTTVVGRASPRVATRTGARPGDVVWVTGTLGGRALGLAALEAGLAASPELEPFVLEFFAPIARIEEGMRASRDAHAMIDVSDGLVADLGHVCRASAVGARIDARSLPLPPVPGYDALARRLGHDPLALALTGGEDFELVVVTPRALDLSDVATAIGEIVAGPAGQVEIEGGPPLARTGHDHFAR